MTLTHASSLDELPIRLSFLPDASRPSDLPAGCQLSPDLGLDGPGVRFKLLKQCVSQTYAMLQLPSEIGSGALRKEDSKSVVSLLDQLLEQPCSTQVAEYVMGVCELVAEYFCVAFFSGQTRKRDEAVRVGPPRINVRFPDIRYIKADHRYVPLASRVEPKQVEATGHRGRALRTKKLDVDGVTGRLSPFPQTAQRRV